MNQQVYAEETFNRLDQARARQYAGRCRAAFAKRGLPAPPWAAEPPPLPRRPSLSKPRRPLGRLVSDEARDLGVSGAAPVTIPPELAAWRREANGVVCLSATGATLVKWNGFERFEARFASTAEAVEALRTNSVNWKGIS